MDKHEEVWCPKCEVEYAHYNYDDNLYCAECLLKTLEDAKKIEVWDIRHFAIEGIYVGDDGTDYIEDIAKGIAKRLSIEFI